LNQSETLEHTLLSILHQDYTNFEIIVIDGGSIDDTSNIIKKYGNWISCYISGKDSGQSNAINIGFEHANGDVFAWINSDDYYLPFAFSRVIKGFSNNNDVDIVIGAGDVITKDSRFLKHISSMRLSRDNLLRWSQGEWIMQQSCFWSSKLWRETGGVDEDLNLLMDLDLWFRFSRNANSLTLNEPLAAMRYYPEIKTVTLRDNVKEESAYILAKNGELNQIRDLVSELVRSNKKLNFANAEKQRTLTSRILKRLTIKL
jgi:glycosyltransferase involved in cell wall biosynthesis